jgi:hypothetical protein
MNCYNCGNFFLGGGCYKTGEQVKVDKNHVCKDWATEFDPSTPRGKEIQHTQRFDNDVIEQYKQAGMKLNLGA